MEHMMAATKQKQAEQFTVPDPSAINDSVNAALAEKAQLDDQHRELKMREAHLSEQMRSYTQGTIKLGETSREEAHALEHIRQQLNEVRHELVIVERAREEATLAYKTHLGKASRDVCEQTRPEWDKRLRNCVLPLFQFIEAHVRQQELKGQLQDREVRWLSFLPNVQFHQVMDALSRSDLVELLNNEVITRDEIPAVVRDRFDL